MKEVDPCKRWKGIWRWWADDMLECCYSLEYVYKQSHFCYFSFIL